MTVRPPRRQLLRWTGWFVAANIVVFMLIGVRYLLAYHFPDDALGIVYVALAYTGQMGLIVGVLLGLPLVLLTVLWPRRALLFSIGVLAGAVMLSLLVLDTQVFAQNRFHLSFLTVALFDWPTWLLTGILAIIALFFEALLAGGVWRNFATWPGTRRGAWLAVVLVASWFGGTFLYAWADATGYAPVTQFARFLPLYFPITAKNDLARLGLVDPEDIAHRAELQATLEPGEGQLRYPLHPLRCEPATPLPNIVWIIIDALRPDAIDPGLTPRIAKFRDTGQNFANHFSGGNSSRMGFFSMFYGLPTTYWQSFYDQKLPPVLIDELQRRSYAFSLQSAAGFGSPTLIDHTVFARLRDRLPEQDHVPNAQVTRDWIEWLNRNPSTQPFFGFLYYDPPIASVQPDDDEVLPMEERFTQNPKAHEVWRRYRLAMREIDAEVGQVLDDLQRRGLDQHTLVIISSDHGYEFDEVGLGYIGHAKDFADAELRATLLMHWPGRASARFDNRTSHHGLPVTLMQDLLGCQNDPVDYSVGQNLFSGKSWDWITAGSYSDQAIILPDRIIVSHPGGFVEVLDKDYRSLGTGALDLDVVRQSMEAMRRYYR